jgi:hypothetical protein
MKRLGGVRETGIQLNAVSLDLRSPAGKTGEGYFRLVINAISDREGRMRRLGGWRPLALGALPAGNEDLHDQLLTNTVAPKVITDTAVISVIGANVVVQNPANVIAPSATISISGGTVYAYRPVISNLPTISIVAPDTRVFVPWVSYLWRVCVRTTAAVTTASPGYVDISYTSSQAGGAQIVRMFSNTNAAVDQDVFAYGCAPSDAVGFGVPGLYDKLKIWNPITQDNSLLPPTNTQILCEDEFS